MIWNSFLCIQIQHHDRDSGKKARGKTGILRVCLRGCALITTVVFFFFVNLVESLLHHFILGYFTIFSLPSTLIKKEVGYGYHNMLWVWPLGFIRLLRFLWRKFKCCIQTQCSPLACFQAVLLVTVSFTMVLQQVWHDFLRIILSSAFENSPTLSFYREWASIWPYILSRLLSFMVRFSIVSHLLTLEQYM